MIIKMDVNIIHYMEMTFDQLIQKHIFDIYIIHIYTQRHFSRMNFSECNLERANT